MDFLSDDGPEEFGLVWDKDAFEKGKAQLEEKEFFAVSYTHLDVYKRQFKYCPLKIEYLYQIPYVINYI